MKGLFTLETNYHKNASAVKAAAPLVASLDSKTQVGWFLQYSGKSWLLQPLSLLQHVWKKMSLI
jgi:hypothetical protein